MKLKVGSKGEIVIPKKVREYIGLTKNTELILYLDGKKIELEIEREDIARKWQTEAEENNLDVSKWIMGDELYEKVF